jgi:hypothetical protein
MRVTASIDTEQGDLVGGGEVLSADYADFVK